MRYKKIIAVFAISLLFIQCERKFSVNKKFISSNRPFEHIIGINKIKVNSLDENGFPVEFDTLKIIRLIKNSNIKTSSKRRIYFYEENIGYYWKYYNKKDSTKTDYDILPMEFERGNWYYIWGLRRHGSPDYRIFIYVLEDGSFKTSHKYTPAPW